MSSYRTAVIGTKEVCMAFRLLGVDAISVDSPEKAAKELFRLKKKTEAREKQYAVVFITEDLTSALSPDDEKKLAKGAFPAIIPIPTHAGSTGYGISRLKRLVEQAVGSDILK